MIDLYVHITYDSKAKIYSKCICDRYREDAFQLQIDLFTIVYRSMIYFRPAAAVIRYC